MPMSLKELNDVLEKNFEDSDISIIDLRGDENHYHATIKSSRFNGLSKVQQHQLVYKALGDDMGTKLHALKLTTLET
ncbi:MAG: BolA family transcriptional regulator [Rickettsiales bacterium]|nr:BolA family transcriptional regulator [Rickettsiales bacterium]|tara:strand:- start:22504 stop:22734 length:231 start_codon:yes stop_codon:yes gene_type:complete